MSSANKRSREGVVRRTKAVSYTAGKTIYPRTIHAQTGKGLELYMSFLFLFTSPFIQLSRSLNIFTSLFAPLLCEESSRNQLRKS
ncbi:hypothetical protein PUN28_006936 [Cardiocondyla obscurior]|uniref:Uncharacterized protein n=1 Tax=Cardiocondyla obscurior TaxID=286306 RepID=A0AAW2G170_9HYME